MLHSVCYNIVYYSNKFFKEAVMRLFNTGKRKQEALYIRLCALERHSASCDNCKKALKCRNVGDVCTSYIGKTADGTDFY
jgi:hypothetical protein